jgi:hypothetical protein
MARSTVDASPASNVPDNGVEEPEARRPQGRWLRRQLGVVVLQAAIGAAAWQLQNGPVAVAAATSAVLQLLRIVHRWWAGRRRRAGAGGPAAGPADRPMRPRFRRRIVRRRHG